MGEENSIIRRETPADHAIVEHLTREAFWNVYRQGCLEHYVVHVLRQDPDFVPELDLVMVRAEELRAGALCAEGMIDFYDKSGFAAVFIRRWEWRMNGTAMRKTGIHGQRKGPRWMPVLLYRNEGQTEGNDMQWKTSSGAASGRWAAKNISSMMAVR